MNASRFSTDDLCIPWPTPSATDPADANYSGVWADTTGKLGLSVAVIQMEHCQKVFEVTEFYESLSGEMLKAEFGQYDSSQWQPHIRHFFHVDTKRLKDALEFLKSGLERSGLLQYVAIGHFDATEKVWREFHPGLAKP